MNKHILKFALLMVPVLVLTSCKKSNDDPATDESGAAQSTAMSEKISEEISDEAAYRMATPGTGCPVISFSAPEGTFPNTMTIDFGTGCTGLHGHVKAGKIIVEMSDQLMNAGAVHIISLDGFSVDGMPVEGVKTVTHMGPNDAGQPYFTIHVEGAKITFSDGTSHSWEADRIRTFVSGYDTEDVWDDVFEITGGENGINRRGQTVTSTITVPVVHRRDCAWPVSGVRTVVCDSKTRTLDFGDGSCDDIATITLPDGREKEIHIRDFRR